MSAFSLGALLFVWPFLDGAVRWALDRPTNGTLVLVYDGSRTCVAHEGGSMCWPLWATPILVRDWYAKALGRW